MYSLHGHRSYLHGSVGPYQSLLGPIELKRTLINQNLKVFIGTWNMNGKVNSISTLLMSIKFSL